jgi:hypothetical protein
MNLYGFAAGDPVNFTDPFGLCEDPRDPRCRDPQARAVDAFNAWIDNGINRAIHVAGTIGAFIRAGGKVASEELAVQGLLSLTGGSGHAIHVSRKAAAHIAERHLVGGGTTAGRSVFGAGTNLADLIRAAENVAAVAQSRGRNFERVLDAGRIIGVDRATGRGTSKYSVITNRAGSLVTMFPGAP